MAELKDILVAIRHWATTGWFNLGNTVVTPARIMGVIVAIIAVWWFARIAEQAIRRFADRRLAANHAPAVYALARIIRYLIWIFGTLFALNLLGFNLTSLALLGGAIGVGIGFGLQNIVNNFLSGIILLIERSLKVGDFVDLESGVRGRVTEISMRFTRVTTNESVDILVPNSEFVNGRVTNWTFDELARRVHIPFGVAYGSDKNRVREAGLAAARRVDGVILDVPRREPDVWLVEFGDSSLNFELVVWIGQDLVIRPARTHAQLLWAIEDELRARGLEIPFPQRDLHVRSGSLRVAIESPKPGGTATPDA
jgi:small-conductance mechanosensitive channel